MRIVIALGGNALLRRSDPMTGNVTGKAGTNVVPPDVPGQERR